MKKIEKKDALQTNEKKGVVLDDQRKLLYWCEM